MIHTLCTLWLTEGALPCLITWCVFVFVYLSICLIIWCILCDFVFVYLLDHLVAALVRRGQRHSNQAAENGLQFGNIFLDCSAIEKLI